MGASGRHQRAVAVVEGAVPETIALLDQHWDLIFFTGSRTSARSSIRPRPNISRKRCSARRQEPDDCSLLGGHQDRGPSHRPRPVLQRGTDLHGSRPRVVWPDVKDEFIAHVVQAVHDFYGDDPQTRPDCGRIINRKSTERLAGLLGSGTIVVGTVDLDDSYVAPTVIVDPALDSRSCKKRCSGRPSC
jgi:hypothetical protein